MGWPESSLDANAVLKEKPRANLLFLILLIWAQLLKANGVVS